MENNKQFSPDPNSNLYDIEMERCNSMERHPTARSARQDPSALKHFNTLFTRALDNSFFPRSVFPYRRDEHPYRSRRIGFLSAVFVSAALTFNVGGSRNFASETITTALESVDDMIGNSPTGQPHAPVLDYDYGFCFDPGPAGIAGGYVYYPPEPGEEGRDENGC